MASRKVLKKKKYLSAFLLLIPLVGFLLFLIPVKYIPGNSINFQAYLFTTSDYLVLLVLSVLESLLLVMLFYQFKLSRHKSAAAGHGGMGMLSVVPAFLFGTKLCPICIAGILGTFGLSTSLIFPLLLNRQWIFLASIGILLLSLYFVSKKVNGLCECCARLT